MSSTLVIILTIAGIALVVAAVIAVLFGLFYLMSELSSSFFAAFQIGLFLLIINNISKNHISINEFLTNFPFLAFLFPAIICIALFILAPRKALIFNKTSESHEKYHDTKYYISSNGEINSYGGGVSTVTFTDYSLYGGGNPNFNNHWSLGIWNFSLPSEHNILLYNRIFRYGEMALPDLAITKASMLVMLFLPSVWLVFLGKLGTDAPVLMQSLLFPSLWYIYYSKKLYFSLSVAKAHGCKAAIYWTSVATDIATSLYNIFVVGSSAQLYKETFGIYIGFVLISSVVYLITHRND